MSLVPLDVVSVADVVLVIDASRPLAAVVRGESVRWLTWADAVLPDDAVDEVDCWATPVGVWVVYRSEGLDRAQSSAVFVSPQGAPFSVDLGDRVPVEADAAGLRIGDPRSPSAWMEDAIGEAENTWPDVDDSALEWGPERSFWPDRAADPQSDDASDVSAARDGEAVNEAATGDDDEDAGWVVMSASQSERHGEEDDDPVDVGDSRPDAEEDPPHPTLTPATELVRISPEGARTRVLVDHLADRVQVRDEQLTVRYHPTGPEMVATGDGGWRAVYMPREVTVDVSAGLPQEIRTDALPSVPVRLSYEDEDGDERQREKRCAPWIDRLEIRLSEDHEWDRTDRDAGRAEHSVAELRAQFEALDAPYVSFTSADGGPVRMRSNYRNVAITTAGTWPDTEIVVTFEHFSVPFVRLRRKYQVFDSTGRRRHWSYVTVHLDEDIETGDIPAPNQAVSGVLDI